MKVLVFGTFYSEGMGYVENCLPRSLAKNGSDVHLVTSNLNVYGEQSIYSETYESFLGPAVQDIGVTQVDGVIVHRLKSKQVFGYIFVLGLFKKLKQIKPDIVHTTEICSLNSYILVFLKLFFKFKLFAETHQHLSVVKPYLKREGSYFKKAVYRLTRTLPTFITSIFVAKCYAIAPDCIYVANNYYGVPKRKLFLQPLGTDTHLFKPIDELIRNDLRKKLGFTENDIVCIYSGRFSEDKNPLLLAKAIDMLSKTTPNIYCIFVGEGSQKVSIQNHSNVKVFPFMKHSDLVNYYGLSDIAIWPTQESMSMLDAAACGLPLIVSDRIGELARISGNGYVYEENNVEDLVRVILILTDKKLRTAFSKHGREKMENEYSWNRIANNIHKDYIYSMK